MKVWVIPSWYPPNGGYFFKEHSQALSDTGTSVCVLATVFTSLKKFPFADPFSAFRVKTEESEKFIEKTRNYWNIPFTERPNAYGWIDDMIRLARKQIKKHGKPDIIQAHSSMWAGVVAARLKKKYGIPYVITEHRSRFVYNTPESKKMFHKWHDPLLEEAFTDADKIVTVSPSLNDRILYYAPQQDGKICSIPNMVDVDFFAPPRDEAKSQGHPFTFFALAYHIKLKGLDTLIDAYKIVKEKRGKTSRLIIGGHGSETASLKEQCSAAGLQDEVSFTGALGRDQVKEHMQKADTFVLPSRFEAFGVVFIEALSCGIPVIAGRAGGPESFISKDSGIIVNPGDPVELSEAMMSMMKNYDNYQPGKIRQYAVENFGKQAVAKKYIELYNEVLNRAAI